MGAAAPAQSHRHAARLPAVRLDFAQRAAPADRRRLRSLVARRLYALGPKASFIAPSLRAKRSNPREGLRPMNGLRRCARKDAGAQPTPVADRHILRKTRRR